MKRALGVAVVATVAFFHRALLGGVFTARDLQKVYFPLKEYWAQRIRAGEFPEWYPYDGLGQSYVGMVISGAFHPLNALTLICSVETAITVTVLLSSVAAIAGTFALARRFVAEDPPALLAGLAYAFSGYLAGITNNLLYLMAAATVPWALWAADRATEKVRWLSGAAPLLALILFAGDVQAFVVTCGLAVLLGIARRRPWPVVGAVALAGGIGAVQWVPALFALRGSMTADQPLDAILKWSTHPLRLLELGLGPIHARLPDAPITGEWPARLSVGSDQLWVESLFVGLPVLVLAGAAVFACRKDRRVLAALGLLGLLVVLALGKHAGLYGVLPIVKGFRYPEKLFPFITLGLALLAAVGLAQDSLRKQTAVVLGVLGAGAAFVNPALGGLAIVFAVALAFLQSAGLRAGVLPAVLFVTLFVAHEPLVQLTTADPLRTPPPFAGVVAKREGQARLGQPRVFGASEAAAIPRVADAPYSELFVAATTAAFEPVTPALFGLEGANAYLPATPLAVRKLADDVPRCPGCARALGIGYVVYSGARPGEIARDGRFRLHLLPVAGGPRVFVTDRRCGDAAAAVRDPSFDPVAATVAECDGPSTLGEGSAGSAEVVRWLPERIELSVHATRDARLVVADAFAPGWEAQVDEGVVPILRANTAVRAVDVPAGDHRVVFTYRTPFLRTAAFFSVLALLICVALARGRQFPD